VQTGPSKTPVAVVLGLVIIIKPITLADFALVGLVCLAVLMIFGAGVSGSGIVKNVWLRQMLNCYTYANNKQPQGPPRRDRRV